MPIRNTYNFQTVLDSLVIANLPMQISNIHNVYDLFKNSMDNL
jgi:hypothetical protein